MTEVLPEFTELPASASKGLGVRLHAWRASDRLTCFAWLQAAPDHDEFTINLAWGMGPDLPRGLRSPLDIGAPPPSEGQLRIGVLMPAKNDIWWAFFERPSMMDGAWAEKSANPPSVESLVALVPPLVDSAIHALVQYGLPYFGRVANAVNANAPERWSTLAASIRSPPTRQMRGRVTIAVAADASAASRPPVRCSELPRVEPSQASTAVPLDAQLARAIAYFEGVRARVEASPMRAALDELLPRYRSLATAASAVVVPFQQALHAKLTVGQRRTLDLLAPDGDSVDVDAHLDGLPSDIARWGQVVFWSQLFASHLRTFRELGLDTAKTGLGPLIGMAEAYQDAVERLA